MSISIDMMQATQIEAGLPERLGRLRDIDQGCCPPSDLGRAEGLREAIRFRLTLRRAKALADERRLLAVAMLRRRPELCACELQAMMAVNHATVSHHMNVLVDAGLVKARRQGKWMYYRLEPSARLEVP